MNDLLQQRQELEYEIKAALDMGLQAYRTAPESAGRIRDAIRSVDRLTDLVLEEVAEFIDVYVRAVVQDVTVLLAADPPGEANLAVAIAALGYLASLQPGHGEDAVDAAVLKVRALIERTGTYADPS